MISSLCCAAVSLTGASSNPLIFITSSSPASTSDVCAILRQFNHDGWRQNFTNAERLLRIGIAVAPNNMHHVAAGHTGVGSQIGS